MLVSYSICCCRWLSSVIQKKKANRGTKKWKRCHRALGPREEPASPLMECFTVGGSPTWKGRWCRPRGSGLSAAIAVQLTTKATLTICVATASMRGASWRSSNHTGWKRALYAAHTRHTSNEKVGFFTSCLCRVNADDLVLDFHCIKSPVLKST